MLNIFDSCSGLTSITIPGSVKSIGNWVFAFCTGLTSVTFLNGVTNIEDAFFRCTALTSVILPNSLISIGYGAFSDCTALTSITIPNSVTSIGEMAFEGCSGLTSIVVESDNPIYDSRDNCNAIIETRTNTLLLGCKNTIIPNSVTTIGTWAFCLCSDLNSITIPNSVTRIGGRAFSDCIGLSSINIPNSVAYIEGEAFWNCSRLSSVIIGSGIETIYNAAFAYCPELKDVYCYAINVPTTGTGAFTDSPIENANLHVPAESINAYKAAEPWKNFKEIVALTDDDPKPTGISSVNCTSLKVGVHYELSGRKIQNPQQGLYIINGKKFIKKK